MSTHFVEPQPFQLAGQLYRFRSLGVKEPRTILGYIKRLWLTGANDLNWHLENFKTLQSRVTEGNFDAVNMIFSLEYVLDYFLDLMTKTLKRVGPEGEDIEILIEEFDDPKVFPMHSVIDMAVNFLAHPDIELFINSYIDGKENPFFQKFLQDKKKALEALSI